MELATANSLEANPRYLYFAPVSRQKLAQKPFARAPASRGNSSIRQTRSLCQEQSGRLAGVKRWWSNCTDRSQYEQSAQARGVRREIPATCPGTIPCAILIFLIPLNDGNTPERENRPFFENVSNPSGNPSNESKPCTSC